MRPRFGERRGPSLFHKMMAFFSCFLPFGRLGTSSAGVRTYVHSAERKYNTGKSIV